MKTQHKTLKIIIKILTLLLALVGTCFLGYKVGTKTLGPIARYNYHLDSDGNIESDNLFDVDLNTYYNENVITIDSANDGFYGNRINSNVSYTYFELYRNGVYLTTAFTAFDPGHKQFTYDFEDYSDCFFYIGQTNLGAISFNVRDVCDILHYTSISFDYTIENDVISISHIMFNTSNTPEGHYMNYEPNGTWYTPQTFARTQWQANYSNLINAKYDMTIYKDNTFYPQDEILIQYEEPQQDNTNRFYISLEKDSNTPNWPSAPYLGQWLSQEFTAQRPYISPGYFSINNSMKNFIAIIQIRIDYGEEKNDPNKYTHLIFRLGGDKNGYYYESDDIYYYISDALLETIDISHDLKIEVPQSIIEQLQSRNVKYISYALKGNETLEEFNFYLDTDLFGYSINYDQAYNTGYSLGYNNGYASALNFEWIKTAFNCVDQVLNIKLIGSITLGNIIAIPLIIGVVKFVIGWFK